MPGRQTGRARLQNTPTQAKAEAEGRYRQTGLLFLPVHVGSGAENRHGKGTWRTPHNNLKLPVKSTVRAWGRPDPTKLQKSSVFVWIRSGDRPA